MSDFACQATDHRKEDCLFKKIKKDIKIKRDGRNFRCELCPYKADRLIKLKNHAKKAHVKNNSEFLEKIDKNMKLNESKKRKFEED